MVRCFYVLHYNTVVLGGRNDGPGSGDVRLVCRQNNFSFRVAGGSPRGSTLVRVRAPTYATIELRFSGLYPARGIRDACYGLCSLSTVAGAANLHGRVRGPLHISGIQRAVGRQEPAHYCAGPKKKTYDQFLRFMSLWFNGAMGVSVTTFRK